MKQYKWKPHKEQEKRPEKSSPSRKPKSPLRTLDSFLQPAKTDKIGVIRSMKYHHRTSSLSVGTLAANVKLALKDQVTLQKEVATVLENAVMEATRVKRQAQMLIGTYIEHVDKNGLTEEDRNFLDYLSPRVDMSSVKNGVDSAIEVDDDGDEVKGIVDDKEAEDVDEDDDEGGSLATIRRKTIKETEPSQRLDSFTPSFAVYTLALRATGQMPANLSIGRNTLDCMIRLLVQKPITRCRSFLPI